MGVSGELKDAVLLQLKEGVVEERWSFVFSFL